MRLWTARRPRSPRVGCRPGSQQDMLQRLLCPLTLPPSVLLDFQPRVSPAPRTPACWPVPPTPACQPGKARRCRSSPRQPQPQEDSSALPPTPSRAPRASPCRRPHTHAGSASSLQQQRPGLRAVHSPRGWARWRLCCPPWAQRLHRPRGSAIPAPAPAPAVLTRSAGAHSHTRHGRAHTLCKHSETISSTEGACSGPRAVRPEGRGGRNLSGKLSSCRQGPADRGPASFQTWVSPGEAASVFSPDSRGRGRDCRGPARTQKDAGLSHAAAPAATTAHGALPAPATCHRAPSLHWEIRGASASGWPPGQSLSLLTAQPSSGWPRGPVGADPGASGGTG